MVVRLSFFIVLVITLCLSGNLTQVVIGAAIVDFFGCREVRRMLANSNWREAIPLPLPNSDAPRANPLPP